VALVVALLQAENRDTKEAAARVLGEKNAKTAVPDLIAALNSEDEFLSLAAVRALGNIGDSSAAAPIAALYDRGYKTTATYSIRRAQDEALRTLTGTSDSLTPQQWQALVAR
jgi:HEAT repeat protein